MFSHGVFNWGKVMLKPEGKYVCCICYWKLSAGEGNGWHRAVPENRVFIQCFTNSPLHRKNCYDFSKLWGVEKVGPCLTAKERVLILPLSPTIPCLLFSLLQETFSIQKSKHSLRNAVYGFLPGSIPWTMCKKCRNLGSHFSALCSFILAAFHQPLPIFHSINSCCMSGLKEVHNSQSQLKKTPSCTRPACASFALNEKQGLLQIK